MSGDRAIAEKHHLQGMVLLSPACEHSLGAESCGIMLQYTYLPWSTQSLETAASGLSFLHTAL